MQKEQSRQKLGIEKNEEKLKVTKIHDKTKSCDQNKGNVTATTKGKHILGSRTITISENLLGLKLVS